MQFSYKNYDFDILIRVISSQGVEASLQNYNFNFNPRRGIFCTELVKLNKIPKSDYVHVMCQLVAHVKTYTYTYGDQVADAYCMVFSIKLVLDDWGKSFFRHAFHQYWPLTKDRPEISRHEHYNERTTNSCHTHYLIINFN